MEITAKSEMPATPAKPAPKAKARRKAAKAAKKRRGPEKALVARAVLEALAKKRGKARYAGARKNFSGKLVEVRRVRSEPRYGYDARVKFPDGKTMYVSPASLRA